MSLLNLLILIPLAAIIAIFAGAPARKTSLIAAVANLLITLAAIFQFDPAGAKFQFLSSFPILPDLDLKYFVGADGLSLLMLLLTTLVTVAAIWATPKIEKQENLFFICVLFISLGAIGAFASLDLFFFYAFHELALIPTFLLIGIWGNAGERQSAAWKITIYLAVGSFILLLGLVGLYLNLPVGQRTLDIPKLHEMAQQGLIVGANLKWIYLLVLVGFGVLVSLFPFHSWAPGAYAAAPTPAAMLHAGVLKKFGLYGLLRVALPLMPDAAQHWTSLLLVLLLGNIIYVGLATIGQKRLDLTLGYSSVMHMGYIFLGIAALNPLGINGAALLMFAHGISIAILFALAGHVREQTGSLEYSQLGGIAKSAPFLGLTFGMAAFASIGLPGFANFASELLVFFGAFNATVPTEKISFKLATILALWGVVISSIYMLRAYRAAFMGESKKQFQDLSGAAKWGVILLLATLMLAGFYPQLFLNLFKPALDAILAAR